MVKVVVVGGGWAGCAAALAARQAGAEVELLERTDMLLGAGLVGGIMMNNGRRTAALETMALGGGALFAALEAIYRHRNLSFPGHAHACLYDVVKAEPTIRKLLAMHGIVVHTQSRVVGVKKEGDRLETVILEDGREFSADSFVDATGTSGPMGNCLRHGQGCALCIQRCPAFGPRTSLVSLAGGSEYPLVKADGTYGAMSGSCKVTKESLSPALQSELNERGVVVVPLPKELVRPQKLKLKVCQQYALAAFAENIILLDTGHAKLMAPFFPLEHLRRIPGFEEARFADPYAAGKGNSMRLLAMARRDSALRVTGVANLFVGGEKQGPAVGHTEAICTGLLAGHNAVRQAKGKELLVLPRTLASGELIANITADLAEGSPGRRSYSFSGAGFFQLMREKNLYSTDEAEVYRKVRDAGLAGVYARPLD
ncbi:MAG TPA: FAD-dependent oxidoreductase [Firmicutes bacterium]|nr:FAD-dependent oxidoreductase [Bacillota bacterium]